MSFNRIVTPSLLRLARALTVTAVCLSVGLHWAALQSAAWVGMAVSYSIEKGSLTEGLSDTFDGEHPCPLCRAVEKGVDGEQESRKDQTPLKTVKEMKLTLAVAEVPHFVFPPSEPNRWSTSSSLASMRSQRPVTPPPEPSCA
ncbi:MAG: hypothetical protein CJBNEKGG_02403 [Prosthecobacter sp.]|nr:hypothetical protein [Prosthecobacter sp.]